MILNAQGRPVTGPPCDHEAHIPEFDPEAARNLPAHEVRLRWPRFEGGCSTCGQRVILYASVDHYTYGDW